MVKYTLCGATGATGRSILRHLLSKPPQDLSLNIVLRNKQKLLAQFPDLESNSSFPIKISTGSNTDESLWKEALRDAEVIMMCIATNESSKGMTLFSDTAKAVTNALRELQEEQGAKYKTPTILILRAITLNEKFNPGLNSPAILFFALRYLYDAMLEANKMYEAAAKESPGLLHIVYVDPPAIHDDEGMQATGYRLDLEPPKTEKGEEDVKHDVSYADLGVAYCEIAERSEEFKGQGVVVTATGEVKTTWGRNLWNLAGGVVGRFW